MPTLNWIGKDKVVNHHLDVPFRTLEEKYRYGDPESAGQNKIIHGDNLEALKSLLPEYEGKIKCIYIDPPYNTGNEGWVYNDNVNHPKIKKWLGDVVGKEGEDLTRHDKWLCMMYPRLKLLHRLLAEDGSLFVSIDDNEEGSLQLVLDELFGRSKRIASVVWQKRYSRENREAIGDAHEYVLVYTKNPTLFKQTRNKIPPTEAQTKVYRNPNNDPRGRWRPIPMTAQGYRPNQMYEIETPSGVKHTPPPGRCWSLIREEYEKLLEQGRIYFGKNGDSQPNVIRYLSEIEGFVPWTWWPSDEVGHTDRAKKEIYSLLGTSTGFDTPKPVALLERIVRMATGPNDLVLDSFAGSATTAHAVLNLNAEDGGNRKFILVELEDYADSITAERVKKVIDGYGEGKNAVEGSGGGFTFHELGDPLFLSDGSINDSLGIDHLRGYIWFTETRLSLPQTTESKNPHLIGSTDGTSYYLIHQPDGLGTLDFEFLNTIDKKDEQYVIYADRCHVDEELLRRHGIIFKKVPRDIVRF